MTEVEPSEPVNETVTTGLRLIRRLRKTENQPPVDPATKLAQERRDEYLANQNHKMMNANSNQDYITTVIFGILMVLLALVGIFGFFMILAFRFSI